MTIERVPSSVFAMTLNDDPESHATGEGNHSEAEAAANRDDVSSIHLYSAVEMPPDDDGSFDTDNYRTLDSAPSSVLSSIGAKVGDPIHPVHPLQIQARQKLSRPRAEGTGLNTERVGGEGGLRLSQRAFKVHGVAMPKQMRRTVQRRVSLDGGGARDAEVDLEDLMREVCALKVFLAQAQFEAEDNRMRASRLSSECAELRREQAAVNVQGERVKDKKSPAAMAATAEAAAQAKFQSDLSQRLSEENSSLLEQVNTLRSDAVEKERKIASLEDEARRLTEEGWKSFSSGQVEEREEEENWDLESERLGEENQRLRSQVDSLAVELNKLRSKEVNNVTLRTL